MRGGIFGVNLLGVVGVLWGALGCSRTPPEPTPVVTAEPAAPRTAVVASGATSLASAAPVAEARRCISKLTEIAPSIPAPASAAACPRDPEPGKVPTDEIAFPDATLDGGAKLKITAELATTPHDVEKGLMYRRSMGDDQGMFFKLDGRRDHTFWMHNTCISLDMMFVDTDGVIVGVVEGASPLSDAVRSVGCESSYVLEVNGGWSRKHGVKPGQRITIPFSAR